MEKNSRSIICFTPYPCSGPSVRHRICNYSDKFGKNGYTLTIKSFMTPHFYEIRRNFGFWNTLLKLFWFSFCTLRTLLRIFLVHKYDVLIIHREAFPLGCPYIEKLLIHFAHYSIYDFDDAIWHQPSNSVNQRKFFYCKDRISTLIQAVDHVVVCNHYLKEYAQKYHSKISIIPTPYQPAGTLVQHEQENMPTNVPTIVWIGNLGNAFYLEDIIKPLENLAQKNHFQLELVGGKDIYEIKSDILDIKYTPWSPENEQQSLTSSSIGIMPLLDNNYEIGKCSFKIIQYFSVRLPVVASPVGMNKDIIQHSENGFLASSQSEWQDYLERLLTDKPLRHSMGDKGYQLYSRKYTIDSNAQKWLTLLDKASQT